MYNGVSVEVRGTTFRGQFFLQESPLIIDIFLFTPRHLIKLLIFNVIMIITSAIRKHSSKIYLKPFAST